MIAQQFVIDFTQRVKHFSEEIEPSFFELTVAMAFEYFAEEKVDIAIIETGLGGRLDSTNIITPELSVITNIGYDHMNMLGDTLEKIAAEKAGIIKPGIPVVVGEVLAETLPVFEATAKERNASLHVASRIRQVEDWKWEQHQLAVTVSDTHSNEHHTWRLDLPGIYQAKNLLTVLEACHLLQQQGWKLEHTAIVTALQQVKKLTGLHGRWEILNPSPLLVVDVAHNEDGIRQLVQQVELTDHTNLHIIIGMVKDKEPGRVLRLLPKHATYYFTKAQIPRALGEDELQKEAMQYGLKGDAYSTVNTAIYASSLKASKNDLIIVCGSIFLAGEIASGIVKAVWGKEEVSPAMFAILGIAGG